LEIYETKNRRPQEGRALKNLWFFDGKVFNKELKDDIFFTPKKISSFLNHIRGFTPYF